MTSFNRKIEAQAEFSCNPELLFEILTDYDTYKDWMPQVRESALLAIAGELAIARLDLVPPGEDYLSLECIHTVNRSVLCRVIEEDSELRSIEWELQNLTGESSRVNLILEAQTRMPVGSGSRGFLDADRILAALHSYAGAFMPNLTLEGETGEVTLEIFETANGMTCWFNGREYEMKPVGKTRK